MIFHVILPAKSTSTNLFTLITQKRQILKYVIIAANEQHDPE